VSWLKLTELLAAKNVCTSKTSRKWVHIFTGPIFMLCWPMFEDDLKSILFAALVPGVITIKFGLIGLGIIEDDDAVRSMSRSGSPRELLYGPFSYGVIHVISAILYWKRSVVGITALILLCIGDGFAGLLGQRYGVAKLPHNKNKTWLGTITFFVFSIIGASLFVWYFVANGSLLVAPTHFMFSLVLVTAVATLIESLPIEEWDNVTVFLASIATYHLLGYH
jgi:phytol kinase